MKDRTLYGCFTTITIAGALAIACTPAPAADIAAMRNQSGGLVVLTDDPCNDTALPADKRGGSKFAYATAQVGSGIAGCYYVSATSIHVLWTVPTIDYRIYPADGFVIIPSKPTTKQSKGAAI